MSELSEVGKGFAGWAEENSGLAVDENFEYTDRTVGNFAAAAFAAGAEWQAQREPTLREVEAVEKMLYWQACSRTKIRISTPDEEWAGAPDVVKSKHNNFALAILQEVRKAVTG